MKGAWLIASASALVTLVGCTAAPQLTSPGRSASASHATVSPLASASSYGPSGGVPTSSAVGTRRSPRCRSSQLTVTLGRGGVAAGTSYQQIDFRNVGAATCTLYGYPSLIFLSHALHAGRPAKSLNVTGDTVQVVSVAPGQTAHASMGVETAMNFPTTTCRPATTTKIRIALPGEPAGWTFMQTNMICTRGPSSTLITPFAPGQPATAVG